jgi:hypothetical protein
LLLGLNSSPEASLGKLGREQEDDVCTDGYYGTVSSGKLNHRPCGMINMAYVEVSRHVTLASLAELLISLH